MYYLIQNWTKSDKTLYVFFFHDDDNGDDLIMVQDMENIVKKRITTKTDKIETILPVQKYLREETFWQRLGIF